MAGDIAYKLTADEAQALAAVARLSREFGLNETAIKKSVDATKQLERDTQEMGRAAARVFEETRTPLEHHERKLKDLDELYLKNKIDAETYGRAVKQSTEGYQHSLDAAHKKQKECFGADALRDIAGYATGLVSVGTAIDGVKAALEALAKVKEEAGRGMRENEAPYARLAQVANRDPAKYKELVEKSEHAAKIAGISEAQGAELVFKLASTPGGMEDLDLFTEIAKQRQSENVAGLMENVSTIKQAAGEKKNLSRRDIMSMMVAAGENSFKNIEELAPAGAAAITGAEQAGISIPEALGAVALSSMNDNPEMARTRQISWQKSIARLRSPSLMAKEKLGELTTDESGHILDTKAKELRQRAARVVQEAGPGLYETVHAIDSLKLDAAQSQTLFGRIESLTQQQILSKNEKQGRTIIEAIRKAPEEDAIGAVLKLPKTIEELNVAQQHRIATVGLKQQDESQFGLEQTLYETAIKQRQKGQGPIRRFFGDMTPDFLEDRRQYIRQAYQNQVLDEPTTASVEKYLGDSDVEVIARRARNVARVQGVDQTAVMGQAKDMVGSGGAGNVGEALARLAEAAEKQERAAKNLQNSANRPRATLAPPNSHN